MTVNILYSYNKYDSIVLFHYLELLCHVYFKCIYVPTYIYFVLRAQSVKCAMCMHIFCKSSNRIYSNYSCNEWNNDSFFLYSINNFYSRFRILKISYKHFLMDFFSESYQTRWFISALKFVKIILYNADLLWDELDEYLHSTLSQYL